MTSPYAVASPTAPTQERRPTYEDLKRRAEEGGYGCGRGVMDTREWYELCYFTPLENFLYEALERKYYPRMDARNIAVCVSTWIYAHSVDTPYYEKVKDRILWSDSYDNGAEVIRGGKTGSEQAMKDTFERGFISYDDPPTLGDLVDHGVVVTLRPDIEEFLTKLVDKECAENDAEILAKHGREAVDDLNKIQREKLLEFDKDFAKYIYRVNEKGEGIPLTEQEQQEWIKERHDRRLSDAVS